MYIQRVKLYHRHNFERSLIDIKRLSIHDPVFLSGSYSTIYNQIWAEVHSTIRREFSRKIYLLIDIYQHSIVDPTKNLKNHTHKRKYTSKEEEMVSLINFI